VWLGIQLGSLVTDQSYVLLLLLDGSNATVRGCLGSLGTAACGSIFWNKTTSIMGYFSQFLGCNLPYMQKLWVLFLESRMLSPKDGLGSDWNVILS